MERFEDYKERMVRDAPPAPEKTYATTQQMVEAGDAGDFETGTWDPPLYDGLIEHEGLVFRTVDGTELRLDVFEAADRKPGLTLPGIMFIHGGGWHEMSRKSIRHLAMGMAQRGYVTASIDYRLQQQAKYPAAVQDCVCALNWFRAHATDFLMDSQRIGVMGNSAGAHLAMLVAYAGNQEQYQPDCGFNDVPAGVRAVAQLYGPTTFERANMRAVGAVPNFIGKSYDEAPERYREASPLTYVGEDSPPTLIMHGTTDDIVPIEQGDLLYEKLQASGVETVYDRIPGWPHGMDISIAIQDRLLHLMEQFFGRYLAR